MKKKNDSSSINEKENENSVSPTKIAEPQECNKNGNRGQVKLTIFNKPFNKF